MKENIKRELETITVKVLNTDVQTLLFYYFMRTKITLTFEELFTLYTVSIQGIEDDGIMPWLVVEFKLKD